MSDVLLTPNAPFPGPIRAVVLDWAGTTVDFGSRAPAGIFREVYLRRGVEVTEAEARGPMGMQKRDHIAAMARMPRVADAWQQVHGRPITEQDVDAMYASFIPLQIESVADYAGVIPGVVAALDSLRERGVAIGSTTGYSAAIMERVVPVAAAGGWSPACIITSDQVTAGRPAPWMLYRAAEALGVWPMAAVVAVDDTVAGIRAARAASCWAVGVSVSGNGVGLSEAEWHALPVSLQQTLRAHATTQLLEAGAHAVVDSVADLPAVIEDIDRLLARGVQSA
jgi:phosphonoacetaldehyde hydrolase